MSTLAVAGDAGRRKGHELDATDQTPPGRGYGPDHERLAEASREYSKPSHVASFARKVADTSRSAALSGR